MLLEALFILNSSLSSAEGPAAPADLSVVKFTGQIVTRAPYQLKFQAPKGHHFNQEAPAKVEIKTATDTKPGKIDKSLQTVMVSFGADTKPAANCTVNAQLYVCNDSNTYCLPIKQSFDCQKLQVRN